VVPRIVLPHSDCVYLSDCPRLGVGCRILRRGSEVYQLGILGLRGVARIYKSVVVDPEGEWRRLGGRKSKRDQVIEWRLHNPDGIKADCIRDTGMDRKTVAKHWDGK